MYPYYHSGMALSANDIGAARVLYGLAGGTPAAVTAPVATPTGGGTTPPPATPPAPLRLTLDPVPASTQASQLTVTGMLTGGTGPFSVQWQTDHGYSGQASLASSGAWSGAGVSLVNGANTLTVTAFDSAHQTATQTASVARSQAPSATGGSAGGPPVTVAITSPASAVVTVNAATISVAGTALGGAGITKVTWQTSTGSTGTAAGTEHWLAPSIPVLTGTTTIVIRAWDANGVNAWAALVAVKY